ncbi:MAG: IS66 family transposase [Candidatus Accumulibacter necessarius]|uniref:IS66 family transposase n=1 Tax=Candidatus Accumulibacter necessarius TaxID=2954386 RepID=UPI002FC2CDF4
MSCIRLSAVAHSQARRAMHLTDHDLRQLDRDALSRLEDEALRRLAERLLADLKEARDRLNQDSRNSSRPPGSDSVYRQPRGAAERDPPTDSAYGDPPTTMADEHGEAVEASDDGAQVAKAPSGTAAPAARRPGRQPGAPGFGRTQKLTVNAVLDHWPERCAACDEPFAAEPVGQAYGGYDEIEVRPADPNAPGLRLWVTQHRFWEAPCGCGHCSLHQPPRALVLPEWQGARVDAQQMLGPRLAGLIVMLCLRYRLSRAKVRELLWELLGLQLSAGLIDQTIRQSAGQVAPVEDLLLEEIERAGLLHLDETPWRESGQLLWLWVFNAVTTVVYFIGARSAEIFVNALQGGFGGCLMSDGYAVYRSYLNRIRCLAHLLRKARGLAEATCRHTSQVGQQLLDLMSGLIQAIQAARDGPSDDLAERQAPALAQLKALCERHQHSPFVKLGEFCREMLNDWEAIIRPLLDPSLPLTNNAAERLLRHWVIARRLSFGTRSEQGTRAFALLASIIDTCRARKASAWDYLTAALQAGRQGLPMPPLPAVSVGG